MLVVDASVMVQALSDAESAGPAARRRLRQEVIRAPELIDIEVMSTLRKGVRAGHYDEQAARNTWHALRRFPLARDPHLPLLARVWRLRDNVTAYDAAYVALAEALGCPLLTADARLARAPGLRCEVELISA